MALDDGEEGKAGAEAVDVAGGASGRASADEAGDGEADGAAKEEAERNTDQLARRQRPTRRWMSADAALQSWIAANPDAPCNQAFRLVPPRDPGSQELFSGRSGYRDYSLRTLSHTRICSARSSLGPRVTFLGGPDRARR